MKKLTYLVMAMALVLGFTQCKKEQPLEPNQTEGVRITLTVDGGASTGSAAGGSRVIVDPTGNNGEFAFATVNFEDGDSIFVGYNNAYVGVLKYQGGAFSGNVTISETVSGEHLHFYFLGGKGFSPVIDGNTATVNISDQSSKYPVISYAPSKEEYSTGTGTYSAKLQNKCSIMKFDVTTPSNSAICITGMNNKVTLNFNPSTVNTDQGFSYIVDATDGGIITMPAKDAENVTWAIVLPQDGLAAGAAGTVYTADNMYEGSRPLISAIIANQYINAGKALTVNTLTALGTPLTFEAKKAGVTVALTNTNNSNQPEISIEYRVNDGDWDWALAPITLDNVGDKVSFRGESENGGLYDESSGAYYKFSCTDDCYIYGNIMSIIDPDYATNTTLTSSYALYGLFYQNDKIYNHPTKPLQLPATTLTDHCYENMFYGCTHLTTAPKLPATTLATRCYRSMFSGCTNLTTAPKLPATSLATECYEKMFNGCTSLTTAPTLSAPTLKPNCYSYMFQGCTGLTTAPALPATTLAQSCYYGMFNGCTILTAAPALSATTLADYCYSRMFKDCTGLTTAPALPASTLKTGCYSYMFNGCTSLATVPALPATTLAQSCYYEMFNGCTSLTTAPTLSATTLAQSCYYEMFMGCTSLTTAPSLPATTLAQYCYYEMFKGCTSLNTAPTLYATTLADYCCQSMFKGCTSLTTAPDLLASTLERYCYYQMFEGCTNLNSIKCLAIYGINQYFSTTDWVSGVAASGTFTKASNSIWLSGSDYIPQHWTVIVQQ